jgi:hypothetical protein
MTIAAERFKSSATRLIGHFGESRTFQRYALVQDLRRGSKTWTAAETVTAKTSIEQFSKDRQSSVTKTMRLLNVEAAPFGTLQLDENWKMVLGARTIQIGSSVLSDDGTYFEVEVDYGPQS